MWLLLDIRHQSRRYWLTTLPFLNKSHLTINVTAYVFTSFLLLFMASSGYQIYIDVEEPNSIAKKVSQSTHDTEKIRHHFDEKTFDGGVFFGSNKKCHILIGKIADGISNRHFAIDLNDHGEFELVDSSKVGVKITYDKDGRHEIRIRQSSIILPEDCKIAIQVRRSIFSIRLSSKNQAQRSSYIEARKKAFLPGFQSLNCHTQQHTEVAPSRATSPELICVDQGDLDESELDEGDPYEGDPDEGDLDEGDLDEGEWIGAGPYSNVVEMKDVRSQVTYAGKRSINISQKAWERELEILKLLRHVSSPFLVSLFMY